jgi:hypothetical protein
MSFFEMEYMCAQCSNDIDDLSPFQDEDAYFCSQACLEEFKNEEDSEQEEEDLTDEEKWKRFEETGILKDWGGDKVIIDNNVGVIKLIRVVDKKEEEIALSNYKKFAGKKLVFKNCANLTKIEADCLDLAGLEIKNCSQLGAISAYNNKIKSLDLKGLNNLKELKISGNQLSNLINLKDCISLESLDVRNNQLTELDLYDNHKLINLNCGRNFIKELNVSYLEDLKFLHCYFNHLTFLNCSNLRKLADLNCHNNIVSYKVSNSMSDIVIDKLSCLLITNCNSLERLDAAENGLTKLSLVNYPNLKIVSLKENQLGSLMIENLPNLEFLDSSRQAFSKLDNAKKKLLIDKTIPTKLTIGKNVPNLKKLFYTEGATFIKQTPKLDENGHDSGYESEEIKTDPKNIRKIFPKLQKFECSTGETHDFEEYLDELRRKKRAKKLKKAKGKFKSTDSGYSSENNEQTEEIITDPAQLTDKNNYPGLLDEFGNESEITIAGEHLTGIMIIDGYQGRKINVGDNYLSYLVVKNCPNLTILRYAHNALKHNAWYDDNNPKLKIIDNHNWDGKIIWDQASHDQFEQGELEPKRNFNNPKDKSNQQDEIIAQIILLIEQAEQALQNKDYPKLEQLITQIKELVKQISDSATASRIQNQITKLEQVLPTQNTTANKLPWIVGSIITLPIILVIIVLLVKKWASYNSNQQNNSVIK